MRDKPRLLDQVRDRIRVKHYSLRTEQACIQWIKRFIFFHGKRHPKDMAAPEVEAFLSHLATEKNVSASTQSQALEYLRAEFGEVYLPYALERKYPNAGREWGWQYVFPSASGRLIPIPAKSDGITSMRRSCRGPSRWRFGMRESPNRRVVMPCAFVRHPSASVRLRIHSGHPWPSPQRAPLACKTSILPFCRTVQELLGQKDVSTT